MSTVILNDATVELPAVDAGLLGWLRDRGLTAAKPGCLGGDCGACQVLLGERARSGAVPRYRTVNSCLLTTGLVAGCHLITVEGLNGDRLTPVQQALVDPGAIQCGYCTPGLVVALTGALLAGESPDAAAVGNLCRCTGYSGIRRACTRLAGRFDPGPAFPARGRPVGSAPRSGRPRGAAAGATPARAGRSSGGRRTRDPGRREHRPGRAAPARPGGVRPGGRAAPSSRPAHDRPGRRCDQDRCGGDGGRTAGQPRTGRSMARGAALPGPVRVAGGPAPGHRRGEPRQRLTGGRSGGAAAGAGGRTHPGGPVGSP